MFALFRPSPDTIEAYLSDRGPRPFHYREVGTTATQVPAGYKIDRHEQLLGAGAEAFERAKEAVRLFKMNDFSWIKVCCPVASPLGRNPVEGQVFATLARVMGIWTLNPCRVVYVIDEKTPEIQRFGFAFGTIEGHAEEGEERFQVEWRREDDSVWYHILAFSRARHILARLGSPVSRGVQRRFFRDSKESMRAFVNP